MKNIWKFVLVAGLVIAILALSTGCFGTGSTAVTTATADGEQTSTWDSLWPMLVFLVVIFAMFYFLMIRPQRKRQKEHEKMMQELQKGDKIVTAGGIYGVIENVRDDSMVIKVEGGTTLRVARNSVALRQENIEEPKTK
ncbi:MAG: preprotein translocase subunit YajC [Dehalococcoidales bacterium]|nr:preprotein translocase subunit YajC [Dehalococcoidales bacterium]